MGDFPHITSETNKGQAINELGNAYQGQKAIGTIRIATQPTDGETVTINAKVYTFQATLTDVDGNVKIGANGAATVANLTAAINLGAGAGTAYADSMTANTVVIMATVFDDVEILLVHSGMVGEFGNSIEMSTDMVGANNSVDATFRGGVNPFVPEQSRITRIPTATEVALGKLHVATSFTPTFSFIKVANTATGATVAHDGAVSIDSDNSIVTIDNSGSVDWSVNDTVHLFLVA